MDSSVQEHLIQYASEGSSLYYACLYYPKHQQQTIIALHGFHQELKSIRTHILDPGVARIKFSWWLQEVEKIADDSSRHPLIKILSRSIKQQPFDIKLLQHMIELVESKLQQNYLTEQEKSELYQNSLGVVWQLCGELTPPISTEEKDSLQKTAAIIDCLNDGFNLLENLKYERCDLSDEFLDSQQFKRERLFSYDVETLFNKLIKPYIQIQLSKIESLLDNQSTIPSQLFSHIIIRINQARCHKTLKTHSPHTVDILPIRKLFIAWSSQRKLRSL